MHTSNPITVGEQRWENHWGLLTASLALESVSDLVFKRMGWGEGRMVDKAG